MKHYRKATREEGKTMKKAGYSYNDYFVIKNTPDEMEIIKKDKAIAGEKETIIISKN